MSLHAVRKINETIRFIMRFKKKKKKHFCQHCLKAKYMQMSTLAAGACTRGISTVCWQPALSSTVLLENAQNAHKGFFCVYCHKVKRPSHHLWLSWIENFSLVMHTGALARHSVLFPHGLDCCTGGAGLLPQKTDGCPSKSCLWLSVRRKGGAKSDQRRGTVAAHCWCGFERRSWTCG